MSELVEPGDVLQLLVLKMWMKISLMATYGSQRENTRLRLLNKLKQPIHLTPTWKQQLPHINNCNKVSLHYYFRYNIFSNFIFGQTQANVWESKRDSPFRCFVVTTISFAGSLSRMIIESPIYSINFMNSKLKMLPKKRRMDGRKRQN